MENPAGKEEKIRRGVRLAAICVSAGLIAFLVFFSITNWQAYTAPWRWRNERRAVQALRQIAAAQTDFHNKDYDGNGVRDHAVPYTMLYTTTIAGNPIALIDQALARATGAASAKDGYFFVDIAATTSGATYNPQFNWGMCAMPARHGITGKNTYVISTKGIIYKTDNGGAFSAYPDNPTPPTWIKVK